MIFINLLFSIIAGVTGIIAICIQIFLIHRSKRSIKLLLNNSTFQVREDLKYIPNFYIRNREFGFIASNRITRLNTYIEILEGMKFQIQVLSIPQYTKEIDLRLKLIIEYKDKIDQIKKKKEKSVDEFLDLIDEYKKITNEF